MSEDDNKAELLMLLEPLVDELLDIFREYHITVEHFVLNTLFPDLDRDQKTDDHRHLVDLWQSLFIAEVNVFAQKMERDQLSVDDAIRIMKERLQALEEEQETTDD